MHKLKLQDHIDLTDVYVENKHLWRICRYNIPDLHLKALRKIKPYRKEDHVLGVSMSFSRYWVRWE